MLQLIIIFQKVTSAIIPGCNLLYTHTTTVTTLSLSYRYKAAPFLNKGKPVMSGPRDSSQDNSSADQERVLGEPSNDEQSQNGDDPAPAPGSLSLFRDGGFKFPKALLEGAGSKFCATQLLAICRNFYCPQVYLTLTPP